MTYASMDLCLVAGRRPELLRDTLKSFSEQVFSNFRLANVLVNIDPIFGTEVDQRACVDAVESHFPSATFFTPETPGFGAAVKRLWSHSSSEYVFHLEDDWIALGNLGEEVLAPFSEAKVMQVSFHTADQNWNIAKKGHIHQRNEYARILGLKVPLFRTFPKFTTSPSILRGEFARQAAQLMNPSLDPEKQFYSGVNPELERLAAPNRNYIFSPNQTPVIRDMGREWRDKRKISKVIRDTTSHWVSG